MFEADHEEGDLTDWDTEVDQNGTVEANGDAANAGSFGADFDKDGVGAAPGPLLRETHSTSYNDYYFRFYFKIVTSNFDSVDDKLTLFRLNFSDTGTCLYLWAFYKDADEFSLKVSAYDNSNAAFLDEAAVQDLTVGTWYRIEGRFLAQASTGGAEIKVDGASQVSDYSQDTNSHPADRIKAIGVISTGAAGLTIQLYIDEVVADDGGWIGA
jgi:hypothetical protein